MRRYLRDVLGQPGQLAEHDYHEVFLSLCRRLRWLTSTGPDAWQIIELGTGFTYPNALLFPTIGAQIAAVDILDVYARDGMTALFRSRRRRGRSPLRAILYALLTTLNARRYHARLAWVAGRPLPHRQARLFTYDGQHLPFPDGSFNVAISNAVLEHVEDLGAFAREVARVLRPGGVVDMIWHNYYSFSGNHLSAELNRAHPWGHLTGEITRSVPSLNRVTPEGVRAAFAPYLTIERIVGTDEAHRVEGEDAGYTREAEALLTPDLAGRLAQYPRELLLTRGFLLQARRP